MNKPKIFIFKLWQVSLKNVVTHKKIQIFSVNYLAFRLAVTQFSIWNEELLFIEIDLVLKQNGGKSKRVLMQ